jgi:hypothetical protein
VPSLGKLAVLLQQCHCIWQMCATGWLRVADQALPLLLLLHLAAAAAASAGVVLLAAAAAAAAAAAGLVLLAGKLASKAWSLWECSYQVGTAALCCFAAL